MLNAQSLRNRAFLAKIGRAMREAVDNAAVRPFGYGAQVAVRNAKGRVTLVVQYSRVIGGLRSRRSGFQFFDYTADLSRGPAPDITPLVLAGLRSHGDVTDAAQNPFDTMVPGPTIADLRLLGDLPKVERESFPYGRRAGMSASLMGAV